LILEQVNPYSTEIRYTLDLMAFHTHAVKPDVVRIATRSVEMSKAVIRRIGWEPYAFVVETPEVQAALRDCFEIESEILNPGDRGADVGLFPFSTSDDLDLEVQSYVVSACYNALSYKTLLYPKIDKRTVFNSFSKFKKVGYKLNPVAGLYSPGFIALWFLAVVAERFHSPLHFQLVDKAMFRLIHYGALWRFSYIVVFTGGLE
jgi:hypothetical protein